MYHLLLVFPRYPACVLQPLSSLLHIPKHVVHIEMCIRCIKHDFRVAHVLHARGVPRLK